MKKIIFTIFTTVYSITICCSQVILNEEKQNEIDSTESTYNVDYFLQGKSDASRYYNGYKGAGTGTLITSLISPLIGLVPAITCSLIPPKKVNLNYPDVVLMNKPEYSKGYFKTSKKIKRGKVWANWGIAFGVNLVAVIIITSANK